MTSFAADASSSPSPWSSAPPCSALSLATKPGDSAFYPLTFSVAVVWIVGGLLSGPLHLGLIPFRGHCAGRSITPIALGLLPPPRCSSPGR